MNLGIPVAHGLRLHLLQVVSSGLKKGRKVGVKGLPGIRRLPGTGLPSMSTSLLQGMRNKEWTGSNKEFSSI